MYTVWSLAADNREPLSATILAGSDRGPAISAGWKALRSTEPPHASEPEPPTVVVIAPTASTSVRQPTNHLARDRTAIAPELQRELKRVGCYHGEINGLWSASTRSAMKAFIARVNAALPVEQPDETLLALLQNHQEKACGVPCPFGEASAVNGVCLPTAILVKDKQAPSSPVKKAPAIITGWTTTTTTTTATLQELPAGDRMALSGPTAPHLAAATEATPDQAPKKTKQPYSRSTRAEWSPGRSFGPWFFTHLDRP